MSDLDLIRRSTVAHLQSFVTSGLHSVSRSPAGDTRQGSAIKHLSDSPENLSSCKTLTDIQNAIGDCKRCPLHAGRKTIVFGTGNPQAKLMFVGEGPGADEDEQGIPFVGRAGQLLTKMIEAMGLQRDDVYIANIVKCRPPGNRAPEPEEMVTCSPFLKKQIELVGPEVIVGLGKTAVQGLLGNALPITKIRGQWRKYAGVDFMPTFHPAFLLRNPPMKKFVWEDLQEVMRRLGIAIPARFG